jgi:hypothetical protein
MVSSALARTEWMAKDNVPSSLKVWGHGFYASDFGNQAKRKMGSCGLVVEG